MMMDKRKRKWLDEAPTTTLRRIVYNLDSAEDKPRSPEYPMSGLVHIAGVGQMPVRALRAELEVRARGPMEVPRG